MSALLYFPFAALVLLAVRRMAGVSSASLAILALLPLLLTGRAMFSGGVYGPIDLAYTAEPLSSQAAAGSVGAVSNPAVSDQYSQFYPWNAAVRDSLRAGQWPLWNRFELCGNPLAGAAQAAPYHPVTIAQWLLPLGDGVTFIASAMFLLAAISAFAFAFAFVRFEHAALVAAAIWMFSTHLVSFSGTALGMSVAILPLVMLAGRRVVHRPGLRSAILLAGSLSLLLLAGHPESTLHVLTLALPFVAFELLAERPSHWKQSILTGVCGGVAALLVCAIYLLPVFDSITQTEEYVYRSLGYAQRVHSSTTPQMVHRLRANVLPWLEGAPGVERETHPRALEHGWIPTLYSGSLAFAAALAGLFASRRRERWFFLGVLIWALALALEMPGLTEGLASLPMYSIAVNDRMVVHGVLALAMLAALGIEAVSARGAGRFVIASLCLVTILAVITVTAPTALAADFVATGAVRALAPLLLLAAAALALRREHVGYALLVFVLIQRVSEVSWMQPTLSKSAFYPPFAGLEVMRSEEPFRIVGIGPMLTPNLATQFGLEDVRGFEAMTLARLVDTYPLWSVKQPVWSNRVDHLDAPMLDAMNVRFAIVPGGVPLPSHWEPRYRGLTYTIAENRHVMSRAWLPRTLHFAPRDVTLRDMGLTRDLSANGWIERATPGTESNGYGTITSKTDGAQLKIHASMATPGWVFVSNAAWRGWIAKSNGKRLPMAIANHAFLAIQVPAGERDITLKFRPQSFVIGAWVSLLAVIGMAAAGWSFRSRD
jgi:hypothetical protein